jgi:AcrR family transcriptional regulator
VPRKNVDLDRILQVSVALADANGFDALTLASVAEQLGIRIPSLYNHVDGLSGLREALTLWTLRQLAEQLRRSAVGKSGDDAVLAVSHAYRAFARAHPGIYTVTQRAHPDNAEISAAGAEVVDVLIMVLAPYGFSDDDTIHAVRVWRSVVHGFVDLETKGGFGIPLDVDETFRRLMMATLGGLKALSQRGSENGTVENELLV